ncbi:MAG: TetR/AcrR family transcriptional regulator [Methylobacteriaceae bacterium]|nr:TetR/AcrR family transcriptional regulator [Methylobacteriaceae bacterium]
MATPRTGRPAGRPTDVQKRDAIVHAAWTLFLERGVEATPIDAVAQAAGVSKPTLYKHFPDKLALFEAGMRREVERIEAAQAAPDLEGDLRAVLRRFGAGLMAFLFSDPAIDFYAKLAGDVRRHERLARIFYDHGPGRTRASLAAILAAARDRGELVIDDAEEAAEHLFGLWQGFSNLQLSLGLEAKRIRDTVDRRVEAGLDAFLRAYGAPSP